VTHLKEFILMVRYLPSYTHIHSFKTPWKLNVKRKHTKRYSNTWYKHTGDIVYIVTSQTFNM